MIINGKTLVQAAPIDRMEKTKLHEYGVTYGASEAGYDIRIKQEITFHRDFFLKRAVSRIELAPDEPEMVKHNRFKGRFVLASSIERFQLPPWLMGVVHDKSTWARRGVSVFNTVLEPGWEGYLTLELVYHGPGDLTIPAGSGIAQVVFHEVKHPVRYIGRYQGQENHPVPAIEAMDPEEAIHV